MSAHTARQNLHTVARNGRPVCSAARPAPQPERVPLPVPVGAGGWQYSMFRNVVGSDPRRGFVHLDATETADYGDVVRYTCPHCGLSWKVELPQ